MGSNYTQEKRKRENALRTIKYFIENDGPDIRTMSEKLGISRSQIQKYLRDPIILELTADLEIPNLPEIIDKLLKRNYEEGSLKGGINYASKYDLTQDEHGRITGYKSK